MPSGPITRASEEQEEHPVETIEIGTTRFLGAAGRDLVHAALDTRRTGQVRYVSRDGVRIAAIVPLGPGVSPCHYCNMLVSRDQEGGIHATHPLVAAPWTCPASSSGRHEIADS
jgi:hypothetical protein